MKKYLFIFPSITFCILSFFLVKTLSLQKEIPILKITQLSLQKEALSSLYLTELLDLSYDKKQYFENFDVEEARENLLASPLIGTADISFIDNSHIKVTYQHLTPIASLGDFINCGVDKEGNLFPIKPFFAKQGLPKLFLGILTVKNHNNIDLYPEKEKWIFAKECLFALERLNLEGKILSIDVSKITEVSLGENEIVVVVQYLKRRDYLRLSKRNYLNEVANYTILCDKLREEEGDRMIDFRHNECAFIEKF